MANNPFPSAFSSNGQLAALGNANFGNFRPQYTLPGGAASSGSAASGEYNPIYTRVVTYYGAYKKYKRFMDRKSLLIQWIRIGAIVSTFLDFW